MQMKPTIRKQPASSVRYGDAIATRGNSVWCAYSDGELICVAATAKEACRKYLRIRQEHDAAQWTSVHDRGQSFS